MRFILHFLLRSPARFNKLLGTVKISLQNVKKAIDGLLVMSSDLEEVFNCVFDNKVPEAWHKVSLLVEGYLVLLKLLFCYPCDCRFRIPH